MSVTVPRDLSRAAAARNDAGLDAWTLCGRFVERILSEAQAAAEREHPGRPIPPVDRASIWQAGDGAPSDQVAIGRVVRAASEAARRLIEAVPVAPDKTLDSPALTAEIPAPLPSASLLPPPHAAFLPEPVATTPPAAIEPAVPTSPTSDAPPQPPKALVEQPGPVDEPPTPVTLIGVPAGPAVSERPDLETEPP